MPHVFTTLQERPEDVVGLTRSESLSFETVARRSGDNQTPAGSEPVENIWGVFFIVCPRLASHAASGAPTMRTWQYVHGWPNTQVQRLCVGGDAYEPLMENFILASLVIRHELAKEFGPSALDFNAGKFINNDDPFIILGPVLNCNKAALGHLLDPLPPDWKHCMVRIEGNPSDE